MSKTHTGPQQPIGVKDRPGSEDQNRNPGSDQTSPLPNENLPNQPYSSATTVDPNNRQHQWNDTPPEKQISEGVTEGSHNVQQEKHGRHGEAHAPSSTGQPEREVHDGTPPSVKNRSQHGHS
jgi:hypothetical protein